ncbi:MAG TPA: SRPBCC domain-containing protein [Rhizobiaceae bacterium]|nr:SRPBCC domain-containing protein [Rhizobiaceae bacterium]
MDWIDGGQGTITEPGTVRIERLLPGSAERLWSYLTESDKRRQWLAAGEMELKLGGAVAHLFRHHELSTEPTPERYRDMAASPVMTGTVTECDPPRMLAYTWPGDNGASEVTFELFPEGGNVLLVITHRRLPDEETMVSVAAGWDAHLGILIDRLNGAVPRRFWSEHERLAAAYREKFETAPENDEAAGVEHKVVLTRLIPAPPDAVYAAWTDPARIGQWAGDHVEADARIGGAYRFENRDGDKVYVHTGEYLVLEPGRRVRMSFRAGPDGSAQGSSAYSGEYMEAALRSAPGGTELTFVNGWNGEGMDEDGRAAVHAAWRGWLDGLEKMFAQGDR